MVNILIRTSNRPEYFKDCIKSIKRQTYKDVNIIVGNDQDDEYCKDYNPIKLTRTNSTAHRIDTAAHFPCNDYLNTMLKEVKRGRVMFLDDDDELVGNDSLKLIMDNSYDKGGVTFWRVLYGKRVVPSGPNWMKRPVLRDISGIGFCFHSKYIPLIHIAPYKQMDYRLADQLYSWCRHTWLDHILTQAKTEGGGQRKDKNISISTSL